MTNKKEKTLVPVCRCNNCMTYFHEDVTTCPKCKTDGYLMDLPELAAAPELADALELLAEYFGEAHADEVDSDHHGDGPEGCTYCEAIGQAWKALKKAGR